MPAKLDFQKRVAADLLGCGVNRVRFDQERIDEIAEAITREEIRYLIKDGAIYKAPEKGVSRARTRAKKRKRGPGSRKGAKYSRVSRKEQWMAKVRAQRKRLKELRDRKLITASDYRRVYMMVKAGAFKSVAAMMEFIKANNMLRRAIM